MNCINFDVQNYIDLAILYIYIFSIHTQYIHIYIYVYLNFSYLIYLLILTSKIILTWQVVDSNKSAMKIDIDQINDKGNIQQTTLLLKAKCAFTLMLQ